MQSYLLKREKEDKMNFDSILEGEKKSSIISLKIVKHLKMSINSAKALKDNKVANKSITLFTNLKINSTKYKMTKKSNKF